MGKHALRYATRFNVGESVAWFQRNKYKKYSCVRTGTVINTNVRFSILETATGAYIYPRAKDTFKLSEL